MFDSGISVKSLVDDLKNEVDIAVEIPDHVYVGWLIGLEQLLYSEVIQEQRVISFPGTGTDASKNGIDFDVLNAQTAENEAWVRFEDVYAVFADGIQLIKTTLLSSNVFPNCYFKDGNTLGLSVDLKPLATLSVFYHVRPKIKSEDNMESENIMLPVEFVDLAKAKLRGEAYKLANEDNLAAKWLNDYNVLLENFKVWISGKQANFGL